MHSDLRDSFCRTICPKSQKAATVSGGGLPLSPPHVESTATVSVFALYPSMVKAFAEIVFFEEEHDEAARRTRWVGTGKS